MYKNLLLTGVDGVDFASPDSAFVCEQIPLKQNKIKPFGVTGDWASTTI